MKKNMGIVDRVARLVVALVIMILYQSSIITGWLGIVLLVVAIIFIITSLLGYCPLYTLIGMNTCSSKKEK